MAFSGTGKVWMNGTLVIAPRGGKRKEGEGR